MLLRASPARSLVLLDFLAPRLLTRPASTYERPHNPFPTLPVTDLPPPQRPEASLINPALLESIKRQVIVRHKRGLNLADQQRHVLNTIVYRIREALREQDADAVAQCWADLQEDGLFHRLQPATLQQLSRFIDEKYLSGHSYDKEWDPAQRSLVEEIAVAAAVSDITDALRKVMLIHLKRRDPEAVVELYLKYKDFGGDANLEREPEVDSEEPILAAEVLNSGNLTSTINVPEKVPILLSAITAHAMQNSFQEALQLCLNSQVPFHNYTTKQFMASLNYDPALQSRVDIYVRRLGTARIVARPVSLSKHIINYSQTGALRPLEKLYRSIVDGLLAPDAYLAGDPSLITLSRSVAMTEVGWTSFLSTFLQHQRKDLAGELWDNLTKLGVPHGTSLWTSFIDAHAQSGDVGEAMAGWEMMLKQGVKPDALTYRAIIEVLFAARRTVEAKKKLQDFRKKVMPKALVEQSRSVYNTALRGLLNRAPYEEASALLKQMEESGPAPDIVSYNTFLGHHLKRDDLKGLAAMVTRMTANGMQGDTFTFTTILTSLLRVGRADASDMVLNLMRKQGIEPTVATYTAIISDQMHKGDEKSIKGALQMLQRMEHDPNVEPNEFTYVTVLSGLSRGAASEEWLSSSEAEIARNHIVERMKRRGIRMNTKGYTILIKSCLANPEPEGLQKALSYYKEMIRQRVPLVQGTWYILLSNLVERKEWGIAKEVTQDMYVSGVQPSEGTQSLVRQIRNRAEQRIFTQHSPGGYH